MGRYDIFMDCCVVGDEDKWAEEFEIVDLLSRDNPIKDTNIIRSMSRAGKPTDNPVNEALNGWIKEELYAEFQIDRCWRIADFKQTIERYVKYYNTQRPCFAIGYDTPENYRKRYYKGELPRKQTFENRVLSPEPKFVQKKRQLADNKRTCEDVSTSEKEIPEKS